MDLLTRAVLLGSVDAIVTILDTSVKESRSLSEIRKLSNRFNTLVSDNDLSPSEPLPPQRAAVVDGKLHMENGPTRLSPGVKQLGTRDAWFNAGYELLTESGVDAVRIKTLAERLKLTRSGFYWHFKDHSALLDALIESWEATNTGLLVARSEAYAETITEGMLNLFDCWHDESKFDPQLDLAIRNWARSDADLRVRLDSADKQRIEAVTTMFRRFNYSEEQAQVRGMAVIYTQVGYISMRVTEDRDMRISRVPHYVEMFTGLAPSESEFSRFKSRHRIKQSKAV